MIVTYVRSSSYNNYTYCEMQYFITYVLGHQPSSGKKAELGTMAHKVMEVLAGLKKHLQDHPKAKLLKVDDDALGKVSFPKKELMTNDIVDKLVEMSVAAYAEKSGHKFYRADRQVVSDTVWTFLKHADGMFDPRLRNIHHPEPHFDIPIEEDWAKFEYEINGKKVQGQLAIKGTIDLVTLVNDDTIEVIDWKTGRRMDWATGEVKDYKKLENDAQLLLYFYAISKLYPEFPNRIMSIFFYKDKDGEVDPAPFSLCFGPQDEQRFLNMLKKRVTSIRNNLEPKPIDQTRTNWKCKYLCHYCKNKWEDSDDNMCIYIEKYLKKHGMDKTIQDCTREGFDIGFYSAPG
jgi:ATP-dependent helicase/DNAse subunit B